MSVSVFLKTLLSFNTQVPLHRRQNILSGPAVCPSSLPSCKSGGIRLERFLVQIVLSPPLPLSFFLIHFHVLSRIDQLFFEHHLCSSRKKKKYDINPPCLMMCETSWYAGDRTLGICILVCKGYTIETQPQSMFGF